MPEQRAKHLWAGGGTCLTALHELVGNSKNYYPQRGQRKICCPRAKGNMFFMRLTWMGNIENDHPDRPIVQKKNLCNR